MPEFVLYIHDHGKWNALDYLTQGYIEALFFCETAPQTYACDFDKPEVIDDMREGRLDGTIPADCGFADLSDTALQTVTDHVASWAAQNPGLIARIEALDSATYDLKRAGNDLYYGHTGAGTGFWDRTELEQDAGLSEALDASVRLGECSPWYDTESCKVEIDGFY